MRIKTFLLLTLFVLPMIVRAEPADELWASLSYEEACEKAEKENKYVFLDFYTEWCAPCKVMDKTTFMEERVIKLLKEKTIPLKIDADKNAALARKFRVMSFPTLVYTKPDGTELGRISGFGGTDAFLEESNRILNGEDALTRAKKELKLQDPHDPFSRMTYGQQLARLGKFEKATKELLWCWDEGESHDSSFIVERLGTVLVELSKLATQHEPARAALIGRRDRLRNEVLSNDLKNEVRIPGEFAMLNTCISDESDTLDVYNRLMATHPEWNQVCRLRFFLFDQLVAEKRYAEIADDMEILAHMRRRAALELEGRRLLNDQSENINEEGRLHLAQQIRNTIVMLGKYYQALVGARKNARAEEMAQLVLSLDNGPDTYNTLAWQGYLTNAPTEANLEQARKADELSKGEDGAITDTLARILHKLGSEEEACALLRKRVMGASIKENSQILTDTVYDLGCKMTE